MEPTRKSVAPTSPAMSLPSAGAMSGQKKKLPTRNMKPPPTGSIAVTLERKRTCSTRRKVTFAMA